MRMICFVILLFVFLAGGGGGGGGGGVGAITFTKDRIFTSCTNGMECTSYGIIFTKVV